MNSTFNIERVAKKARYSTRSKTYIRFIEQNEDVEPMFTKDFFCEHPEINVFKWKCKKCGNVFESKCWEHASLNMPKIARCLKCYPLNCRESKTENEVCKYVKSVCNDKVF